ncbi:type II/IV secretion system ATPase subunit [Archaeoglobus fulgidus]|nr:type II/IV secretion system ATPase subunit [Archaeoglobus fulgidus]AIG97159.1 Type IV secretory pathway, VirB11 component [Archaeoglobus fulgidus DSM 8774]
MPTLRFSFKKKEDEVPRRTAVFEIIKKGAKEEFLGEETYRTLSKRLSQEFEPPEGWIEVEGYPVYGRFVISSVHILYNEEDNEFIYHVNEPKLSEEEEKIVKNVIGRLEYYAANPKEIGDKVGTLKKKIDSILEAYRVNLEGSDYFRVLYHIFKRTILYGKITPIMYDPMIEDISCNGYGKYIYIFHRKYTNLRTNVIFDDPDELDSFVVNLAQKCGKHISIAEPMVDATMPDGSRIQMTLGREVTDHGSTFTIRKFREEPVTPIDLIAWKTFSSEQMAYLWLCIENKKSLIFAGGTASGKTTSMNAISLFIPRRSKIVTIEDTRELMLPHENWIPAVTRDAFHGEKGAVDMYDLLRAALRQRPEYIIVGEVRGREALTLFQAMATGHTTYSTLHADSISGAIHRLENPPIGVPRPMLEALDIISIQAQTYVGDRRVRRNMEIAEIVGLDAHTKMLRTSTVFQWDSVKDEHAMVGTSKALEEIRRQRGWSVRELNEELERRRRVLEFMLSNGIRMFKDVSAVIHTYQVNPERAMKRLGVEEL